MPSRNRVVCALPGDRDRDLLRHRSPPVGVLFRLSTVDPQELRSYPDRTARHQDFVKKAPMGTGQAHIRSSAAACADLRSAQNLRLGRARSYGDPGYDDVSVDPDALDASRSARVRRVLDGAFGAAVRCFSLELSLLGGEPRDLRRASLGTAWALAAGRLCGHGHFVLGWHHGLPRVT
jgi:hypothetical protein